VLEVQEESIFAAGSLHVYTVQYFKMSNINKTWWHKEINSEYISNETHVFYQFYVCILKINNGM